MACWTVVIFSASSSGISVSNSSSRAMTSSTVSSESAPRSSTNDDSFLISASFTPSCSATIFLTRCSTFSMRLLPKGILALPMGDFTRSRKLRHVHATVHMQRGTGYVARLARGEERDQMGDILRQPQSAQGNARDQLLALFGGKRACHVGVD